jgi:hypothetical protein
LGFFLNSEKWGDSQNGKKNEKKNWDDSQNLPQKPDSIIFKKK